MHSSSSFGLAGRLRMRAIVPFREFERDMCTGLENYRIDRAENGLLLVTGERPNAFVNSGLQIALDRLAGINGPPAAISHMAVSADDQAVTASTTKLDPAGGDTGFTSVAVSNVSRTNQTVSFDGAFNNGTVAFEMNKVGLLNGATDAGTGLIDVIGGTGGSSPYNEPFAVNFTAIGVWSLTFGIDITASAT